MQETKEHISYKKIGIEKFAHKHFKETGDPIVVFQRVSKSFYCSFKQMADAVKLIAESPLDLYFYEVKV